MNGTIAIQGKKKQHIFFCECAVYCISSAEPLAPDTLGGGGRLSLSLTLYRSPGQQAACGVLHVEVLIRARPSFLCHPWGATLYALPANEPLGQSGQSLSPPGMGKTACWPTKKTQRLWRQLTVARNSFQHHWRHPPKEEGGSASAWVNHSEGGRALKWGFQVVLKQGSQGGGVLKRGLSGKAVAVDAFPAAPVPAREVAALDHEAGAAAPPARPPGGEGRRGTGLRPANAPLKHNLGENKARSWGKNWGANFKN